MHFTRVCTLIVAACMLASCGTPTTANQQVTTSPATTAQAKSTRVATAMTPMSAATPTSSLTPSLTATQEPTATGKSTASPLAMPQLSTTPESSPTAAPRATDTATPIDRKITITSPHNGATITSPVTVVGETNYWPFEANLVGEVKDANGNILGRAPITVQAPDIGQGGPFEAEIPFDAPLTEQAGTIALFEASAKDGSIVASTTVAVRLTAAEAGGLQLDAPEFGQDVTLPLHVALRISPPQQQLLARLVYSNNTVLDQPINIMTGADGIGYGVLNLQWNTESAPPPTEPGAATFQILRPDGTVLKELMVNALPDEATQQVDVAWTSGTGDEIVFQQRVPQTKAIGTAALNELLNGPPDGNLAGASTALPTVDEIVTFPGREPDWGYEVKLLGLTIEDGVATANFSQELRAYGGGAARVRAIREQIERTLKQFPTVQTVVIQIEGETEGVLEP